MMKLQHICRLHRECELALGPAVVHQVMELLNRIDPEESQVGSYVLIIQAHNANCSIP